MPKFAANLTMFYADSPFLERFARARASGFHYCEYLFPYEYDADAIARALRENDLTQVLFDMPPGNWSAGERGIATFPDRIAEFRTSVDLTIKFARVLGVRQVNCLAGKRDDSIPYQDQRQVLIENIRFAAAKCADHGITLLFEMLNPKDMPGYWISTPRVAFELQELVSHPNVKVLFDVYHAQRTEGELANTLQKNLARIGHIQIADNPGRHQPGTGEINFRYLFGMIDRIGYQGWVGLEYIPEGNIEQALGWVKEYGYTI